MDKKLKARAVVVNLKHSISGLSKQQRKAIISMGFKPFLSLEVETISTRLAQWLLSNYDSDNNKLNAGNHTIKGRLPINEKIKPRLGSSNTLNVWKAQYQNKSRIIVKDVLDQIKSNENGDCLFKLNWLVVYYIVLGWTTKSTTVKQRFLNSIIREIDIPNMNWCEYLITCLQRTKKEWTSNEPFNGPLLFLALLYVHGKRTRYLSTLPPGPTIENITNNYLIELDSHIYENGPFTDYETGSPEEACDFGDDESDQPLDSNVSDDEEGSDRVADDVVVEEEEDDAVAVDDSHVDDVQVIDHKKKASDDKKQDDEDGMVNSIGWKNRRVQKIGEYGIIASTTTEYPSNNDFKLRKEVWSRMVWDPQPISPEVVTGVECHVDKPLDVTPTFVQEMVKACEVVELQISSSKGKENQSIVEDEHPGDADDAAVVLENKDVFANYLLNKDHPNALKIYNLTSTLLDLPWKTTINGVDCGVFSMRHMETYMGGGLKRWKTGLNPESESQRRQLNQLRFKYLCKILLSNVNILKYDVVIQARDHDSLDQKKKQWPRQY
ncbi:hypothetical protein R6Q57_004616 [Mikania cordata]